MNVLLSNEGTLNELMEDVDLCTKCNESCLTKVLLWFTYLSWINQYQCCWSMVASKEYLVWVVAWDATHILHKYDLRLP